MHLLIPAYNPVSTLPEEVAAVLAEGVFSRVIIVNDGSSPEYVSIFSRLEALPGTLVLHHERNRGKGGALKTGMTAALEAGESLGIVTADADGQHSIQDIVRVALALKERPAMLVLGVREFGSDVPLRSKFGNILTRNLMRFFTGQAITDTQTGLRGIPVSYVPQLLEIDADGYEFEMDMLVQCKGRYRILEVPIRTIYIDGNATSHFNPIMDSMRIYLVLFRFVVSSVLSALVDNVIFAVCFLVWPNIAGCQVLGRLGSLCLNYSLNRSRVFRSSNSVSSSMPKYLGLVVFSGLLSYGLIRVMSAAGMNVIIAKLLAETLLFFFNFVVQRSYIFKHS
jgi:glycosyltransferase involved in cell wall biosynthesis